MRLLNCGRMSFTKSSTTHVQDPDEYTTSIPSTTICYCCALQCAARSAHRTMAALFCGEYSSCARFIQNYSTHSRCTLNVKNTNLSKHFGLRVSRLYFFKAIFMFREFCDYENHTKGFHAKLFTACPEATCMNISVSGGLCSVCVVCLLIPGQSVPSN